MRTVATHGEAALLRPVFRRFRTGRFPRVRIGTGDDAAALSVPGGRLLVASQDDLVEGTHFELRRTGGRLLARRLFGAGLSDLAGMGAVEPLACLVSASLPPSLPRSFYDAFLDGAARASARFLVPLVGGNLARSRTLSFTITVLGSARPRDLVTRRGAKPGDLLAGVGPLGEAAAGLDCVRKGPHAAWTRPLLRRFWEPEPLFGAGRALAGLATSLMDNSDGLARSARILSEESGVELRVSMAAAPASRALRRWCGQRRKPLRRHQFLGGEDYGLVFTVPPRSWLRVRRAVPGAYLLGGAAGRKRGGSVKAVGLEGGNARVFEHFR